jgi:uncharacterized protein YqhQ
MNEVIRLGGMALSNGVLVHGPRNWACAIRTENGELRVAAERKRIRSVDIQSPMLRAPARLAEVFALLPAVGRALPEAKLPFFEARVAGVLTGTALGAKALRSSQLSVGVQEALASLLAVVPIAVALRGTTLAAYHGAEHIAIGSYEHGEPRPREHERCGSHMLGPLLVSTAAGNALASLATGSPGSRALARGAVAVGSVAVAGEIFAWMLKNPRNPVSRVLAWPGRELQSRFLTAEPTGDQLEVARLALVECVRLELADESEDGGTNGSSGWHRRR